MGARSDDDADWALVLRSWGGFDLKQATAAIAGSCNRLSLDVSHVLRRSPGLPFTDLTRDEACRAVDGLNDVGVPALAIPAANVGLLPRAVRVESARIEEDSLTLVLISGQERTLTWNSQEIALLSAAVLLVASEDPDSGDESEPLPDPVSLLAAAYKRSALCDPEASAREEVARYLDEPEGVSLSRLVIHADVLTVDNQLMRIHSDSFQFRCLGNETRSSTLANMRRLVTLLDDRFDAAVPASGTWDAVAIGDLASAAFASTETYMNWLRWRSASLEGHEIE